MNQEHFAACVPELLLWYDRRRRILPWREEPTPYRVWVSEIMLQQTRVEAVLPYYERFLQALPDVRALAEAEDELLMKLWEGLGYYSRVRNLKKAAQEIVQRWGGATPTAYEDWLSLPGIGAYTAGAIASIACGQRVPCVDGNVLRVYSRIEGQGWDILSQKTKRTVTENIAACLPERVGDFNQALMELGALVCLPNGAPLCGECPAYSHCIAGQQKSWDKIPDKAPKKKRRVERRTVYLLWHGDRVALRKRPAKGLLAGLWEFPNTLEGESLSLPLQTPQDAGQAKHVFSHVEWHMTGIRAEVQEESKEFRWVTRQELEQLAIPSAFRFYRALVLGTRE